MEIKVFKRRLVESAEIEQALSPYQRKMKYKQQVLVAKSKRMSKNISYISNKGSEQEQINDEYMQYLDQNLKMLFEQ